jgi:hypothetical protein
VTDAAEEMLFDMPSYQEWLNKQNEQLDRENFPANPCMRGWQIAGETPAKFFGAIAYKAAYPGTANYLRRQGRKAVPGKPGEQLYKTAQQMTLLDLQSFIIANYDRRMADAKTERQFVADWCEAHHGYTIEAVYKLTGVPVPAGGDVA